MPRRAAPIRWRPGCSSTEVKRSEARHEGEEHPGRLRLPWSCESSQETLQDLACLLFALAFQGRELLHRRAVAEFPLIGDSEVDLVASYRFAVDASDLDQALTQLAPGQSEHPDHPHADDGLGPWLRGQPSLLSTSDPVIEDGPVARLRLVPTSPGAE